MESHETRMVTEPIVKMFGATPGGDSRRVTLTVVYVAVLRISYRVWPYKNGGGLARVRLLPDDY